MGLRYAGVWRAGADQQVVVTDADWSTFGKWQQLSGQGLRLVGFKTYVKNNLRVFSGVFRSGGDAHYLWVGVDWANFVSKWNELGAQGLRLTRMRRYLEGGQEWFARVWRAGADGYYLWVGVDSENISSKTHELEKSALRLVNWLGNTIVVSHDSGGAQDAFRTVYMHLRNGADHDANASWNQTVPSLSGDNLDKFKNYLNLTGAVQDPAQRNLNADYWGTNAQTIDPGLLNAQVARGQHLAWAGATGPGGCGFTAPSRPNTHLHIFFCRRDPSDNQWYLIDPYGVYAHPGCYPGAVNQAASGPCVRYGIAWKDGHPQYP